MVWPETTRHFFIARDKETVGLGKGLSNIGGSSYQCMPAYYNFRLDTDKELVFTRGHEVDVILLN